MWEFIKDILLVGGVVGIQAGLILIFHHKDALPLRTVYKIWGYPLACLILIGAFMPYLIKLKPYWELLKAFITSA